MTKELTTLVREDVLKGKAACKRGHFENVMVSKPIFGPKNTRVYLTPIEADGEEIPEARAG